MSNESNFVLTGSNFCTTFNAIVTRYRVDLWHVDAYIKHNTKYLDIYCMFVAWQMYLYHQSLCPKMGYQMSVTVAQNVAHSAWIVKLECQVSIGSKHLRHFLKNIRSWVENECYWLCTVDVSNINFIKQKCHIAYCLWPGGLGYIHSC